MKKLMLMFAGLLFVSVMAVNAQVAQDTTKSSTESTMGTDQSSNYTKDMELIQSSDVPASLRSTLQGTEYSGWEQGKVYRNAATNEYLIVIGDDDAKLFRFDANGSRIEDKSGSGSSESATPDSGSGSTGTSESGTTGSGSTGTTGTPADK